MCFALSYGFLRNRELSLYQRVSVGDGVTSMHRKKKQRQTLLVVILFVLIR